MASVSVPKFAGCTGVRVLLNAATPLVEVSSTKADWEQTEATTLLGMLGMLHVIRAFEETVLALWREGLIHGPAHSSIGQEAGAVGSILPLRDNDQINGSHRGHHQFLAKAMNYLAPRGLDPRGPIPADIREMLYRALAEIMGLAPGFCRGRGGSMHLRWKQAGILGTNAIVGGGVPFACGAAWAHRFAGTDAVVVTYIGDGAANIGSVLESMNLAAAWDLPVIFFIENNQYAVATTVAESTREPRLAARGLGFAIPAWRVDGMDPIAVHLAMQEALAHTRGGGGPAIIEADVYRYYHQNGGLPGSAFGYRTKAEEALWQARDPLNRMDRFVAESNLLTSAEVSDLHSRAADTMASIADMLTEQNSAKKKSARSDLWPKKEFRDFGIRGDLSELSGLREEYRQPAPAATVERKFVDVIADVLRHRMVTDTGVVLLGEDIHRLKGGTNGATRGLSAQFPNRVLGTPISENAFCGLAGGIAIDGRFKPVIELMYADFLWVAADQLFNQIGKVRHMFGGDTAVPLVLRTKVAMGTGYGSQHSMDPAGIFATSPGWRIAAPSTAVDYVGIMNAALACNDPVLVIEHVDLYKMSGTAVEDLDFVIPPGKAVFRRHGQRGTVLAYLSMVHRSMEAANLLDADVDVIDLRWLDRASLDWSSIEESVRRTNRVLIVEQGPAGTSYGAWLSDEIQRRLFDWLDHPVMRVTGGEASPSISKVLEGAAIAGVEEISQAVESLLR
jgi:2-oxoisovalerate dehydrogenase E1 component